jgi:hypothetical protein
VNKLLLVETHNGLITSRKYRDSKLNNSYNFSETRNPLPGKSSIIYRTAFTGRDNDAESLRRKEEIYKLNQLKKRDFHDYATLSPFYTKSLKPSLFSKEARENEEEKKKEKEIDLCGTKEYIMKEMIKTEARVLKEAALENLSKKNSQSMVRKFLKSSNV